jgi:hypothetical protein
VEEVEKVEEVKVRKSVSQKVAMAALVAAVAMLAWSPGTAQDAKIDVTGKWVFNVETSAGSGTPTVTLKQDGEKLSGHYSSMQLGEADLTGSVKGRDIAFTFTANVLDMQIPVSYSGTIEGKDAMKGKIVITGLGDGTFTGKRQ